MFYCWCFFFYFNTRSPSSVSRSPQNFATLSEGSVFDKLGPKIWGPPPKKVEGHKRAKFGSIADHFKVQSRMSLEWIETSKIGKTWSRVLPPTFGEKSGELWSTNHTALHVDSGPYKSTFSEDHISAPRGAAGSNFHTLENDQGLVAHTPPPATGDGCPPNNFYAPHLVPAGTAESAY